MEIKTAVKTVGMVIGGVCMTIAVVKAAKGWLSLAKEVRKARRIIIKRINEKQEVQEEA